MTQEEMEAKLNECLNRISELLEKKREIREVTPAEALGAMQGLLDGFSFHFPETKKACIRLSAKLNENFLTWGSRYMPPNG